MSHKKNCRSQQAHFIDLCVSDTEPDSTTFLRGWKWVKSSDISLCYEGYKLLLSWNV